MSSGRPSGAASSQKKEASASLSSGTASARSSPAQRVGPVRTAVARLQQRPLHWRAHERQVGAVHCCELPHQVSAARCRHVRESCGHRARRIRSLLELLFDDELAAAAEGVHILHVEHAQRVRCELAHAKAESLLGEEAVEHDDAWTALLQHTSKLLLAVGSALVSDDAARVEPFDVLRLGRRACGERHVKAPLLEGVQQRLCPHARGAGVGLGPQRGEEEAGRGVEPATAVDRARARGVRRQPHCALRRRECRQPHSA
eukprot:6966691-Prymnesium_polylepis.2